MLLASGVYDVSVCMCGYCCLFVVVMGKNGGFLPVCGVLMAVDWGKAGRFGCFFTVCCDFGLCGDYDCVIRRWFPGVFGALICRKFCLVLYFLCASMCLRAAK